ncbi:hypothetical protein [Bailinhaonella thermotolerans]|nr:hypothetical protein [Bailinhaonella thermotolerans]
MKIVDTPWTGVALPPPSLSRLTGDRHELVPTLPIDSERIQNLKDVV